MITKQEQEILDNAPEGMDFYITHSVTGGNLGYCRRGDGGKEFYVCNSLADLRKKQGKTVWDANLITAINETKGEWSWPSSDRVKLDHDSDDYILREEFNQCVKEMSEFEGACLFGEYLANNAPLESVKKRIKVEYVKVEASEAVYYFTETDDEIYPSPNKNIKPISLQDYINDLAIGEDSIYRKVETEIKTEKRWVAVNGNICTSYNYKTKVEMMEAEFSGCAGNFHGFQAIEITVEV